MDIKRKAKKVVYLVRHGESVANAENIVSTAKTPLTKNGEVQARFLAERIAHFPITTILASSHTRARQTADTISQSLKKEVQFNSVFREVEKPSELRGRPFTDEDVYATWQSICSHKFDPNWRHSDEENVMDQIARGLSAINSILDIDGEHILVVSHGLFIRAMLACMVFGEKMTPEEYWKFTPFFHFDNTGITICMYDETRYAPWQVLTSNDRAHLG